MMISLGIVVLYTLSYILEASAEVFNLGTLKNQSTASLPAEFSGLYPPDQYLKSQEYLRVNTRFGLFQQTAVFAALVGFFWIGGFRWADDWARSWNQGEIVTGLLFIGSLSILRLILGIPFRIYHTFVIEQRFGFNRTTPAIFLKDTLQGLLIGALLGSFVFSGIIYFFQKFGASAWWISWLAVSAFQILITFLAPAVLMPLFNKFVPIEKGEIKDAVDEYAKKNSFSLQGIYTMDGSKRSTKANAFFTGFGKFRKLVLFDTLVNKLSLQEVMAVFAHEVGHFKLGHIVKSTLISLVVTGAMFYVFGLLMNSQIITAAFQIKYASIYASLVTVSFTLSPILALSSFLTHWISRKHEFEADEYSKATFGNPQALASALKKLSVDHLSHLQPHPLKVAMDYTHPPVLLRVRRLLGR